MAVNKRKVLDAARKYAQKGAKEKALKEYHTLLKLDPRDAKLHLEIGDCYRRWGQIEEAITQYSRVAEQYKQDGFDARAVAVFKQILNLDPKGYASYVSLSELYQRMGLDAEALTALQSAADGYHREGNKREALELLRKMATLDPTNTTSRLKVAELLRQEGMEDDAVAEYEAVAAELDRQGASESTLTVRERILELCPDRNDVRLDIARSLVDLRKPERAEAFAKKAVENDPENSDAHELLCDLYKALGRNEQLSRATRALAKLYREQGDDGKARELAQRLPMDIELDGEEAESPSRDATDSSFLGDDDLLDDDFLAADASEVEEFSEELPLAADDELELDDEADSEELTLDDNSGESDELELFDEESTDDDSDLEEPKPEGDPDQLLAEASVYLRYGKRGEAIASLKVVLEQEPEHRAALEKLGDAYAENEEADQAVEMWSRAAQRARRDGDDEGFAVLRDRITALDAAAGEALDDAATVEDPLQLDADGDIEFEVEMDDDDGDDDSAEFEIDVSLGGDESEDEELDLSAGDIEDEGVEIEISDDEDPEEDIEIDVEVDLDKEAAAGSAFAGASSATSQEITEDLEEADFYFQQELFVEAERIYRRILKVAPNHPSALLRLGELAAAKGDDPTEAPVSARTVRGGQAEGRAPGEDSTEVAELFIDVDQEDEPAVQLDLPPTRETVAAQATARVTRADDTLPIADAEEETALEAADFVEDEPEEEVTRPEAASFVSVAAEVEGEEEQGGFDLAAELRDAIEDDEDAAADSQDGRLSTVDDGFESIFADFKQGVSATLSDDDFETRYDLGIAYREMELYEDAIGEFRTCLSVPKWKLPSLHLMGLCQLDLGRATDAANHIEQALATEGLPDEQLPGLRFDLGRAYEVAGDLRRARSAYEQVKQAEPEFPGVAERIERLASAMREAPVEVADDPDDDGFESFDDLVAEAQADDEVEETESFESFDDIITEADAAIAEPLPEVETETSTNPWGGWTSPNGKPTWTEDSSNADDESKTKKRKKKISFV